MADWRTLIEAAKAGKRIVAQVSPGQRVVKPKRTVGRPRAIRMAPYSEYVAWNPRRGGRPRCRKHGCEKYLRKSQRIGCCEEHERQAIEERKAALAEVT